jgi:hypothetical protein
MEFRDDKNNRVGRLEREGSKAAGDAASPATPVARRLGERKLHISPQGIAAIEADLRRRGVIL